MTNKKILYLVTQSEWGGAQKYVLDLAVKLKDQFNIVIGCGEGNNELLKKSENENIKTLKLKYLKRAISPLFDLLALFELIKLIKKEKPDIIHLNSSKISILGTLAAKMIFGHKSLVIYTVHGWVFNEPLPWWQKLLYFILEKWTAKLKDKIICVSNFDKKIAIQNNVCPLEKIVIIHNGIDINNLNFLDKQTAQNRLFNIISKQCSRVICDTSLPRFAKRGRGYEIQDTRYAIIGTIANLYKTKGLNYLIEAAAKIIEQNPQTLFIVIGDGSERKNLESQINHLNLQNNFFLLGKIDNAYQYLKAFDAFVLPSVKEGLPYTILEALAAGLSVITTNVGGIPEIIKDGINGLLVTPANADTLTNSIIQLLNDNELQQKLTQNIDLTDFSLQKMIDATVKLYK